MEQIGLPRHAPLGGQHLLETSTPDGRYRYLLLAEDTVVVQKRKGAGFEDAYVIRHGICPCKSYQYRQDCKHIDVARGLSRIWRERAAGGAA